MWWVLDIVADDVSSVSADRLGGDVVDMLLGGLIREGPSNWRHRGLWLRLNIVGADNAANISSDGWISGVSDMVLGGLIGEFPSDWWQSRRAHICSLIWQMLMVDGRFLSGETICIDGTSISLLVRSLVLRGLGVLGVGCLR